MSRKKIVVPSWARGLCKRQRDEVLRIHEEVHGITGQASRTQLTLISVLEALTGWGNGHGRKLYELIRDRERLKEVL